MSAFLQRAANKVLSLVGYEEPSSNATFWTTAAIIGGTISISLIVSFIPVTVKVSKIVSINKSGKEVYDYLTETDAKELWENIHPGNPEVKIKEEFGSRQTLIITQKHITNGRTMEFTVDISRNSATKTIVLDAVLPILYGLDFNATLQ
eukprot:372206_1